MAGGNRGPDLQGLFRASPARAGWGAARTSAFVKDWQPGMAKGRPEDIPALVLAVIAKVYELSGRRTQPWYISRSAVELVDAADAVNSAIYHAEVSGWLVGSGEPPNGVAITADGVELLKKLGMI
jgi:hypothetical protein